MLILKYNFNFYILLRYNYIIYYYNYYILYIYILDIIYKIRIKK